MDLIRYFQKCKRRKGFTLVELIVVVALLGLLMACVVAFATPVRQMIKNTNARDDALKINKIIGDYIERKLAYANYLDIYVGRDFKSTDTMMSSSFTTLQGKVGLSGQTNKAGILLFKFEQNPANSLENTFKVYDIEIKSTGSFPTVPTNKDVVFTDDFYAGYQYFITTDDWSISTNTLKQRAYLNFKIDAYNITGDYSTEGMHQVNEVGRHYLYVDPNHDTTTLNKDPMDKFLDDKIGTEEVSFALENIIIDMESQDLDSDGVPETVAAVPQNITIQRGYDVIVPEGDPPKPQIYTQDMVIFYNIRKFNVKSDTFT